MKVGIEENVGLTAELNDKGTLVITADRVGGEAQETKSEKLDFDLDSTEVEDNPSANGEKSNIILFPLQLKGYENKELVEVRSASAILASIKEFRTLLTYILSQYVSKDEIEWSTYADSDYTKDNVTPEVVRTQAFLDVVYRNYSQQFVDQMKKFGDPQKPFRVLFVRSSKKSHYPAFRTQNLSTNPFIEPMDVPAELSKLAFQKWEIDAGRNSGKPLVDTQSQADKDTSALGDAGL